MKKCTLIAVLALVACGRSNDGSGGAGGSAGTGGAAGSAGTGGSGGGTVTTIAALRMSPPGAGTTVSLSQVVVVQRVSSSNYGHVWVQDLGGGPYSGIHLFCDFRSGTTSCPMVKSDVDTIQRGMKVDVSGRWNPYTPPMASTAQLEISHPMITSAGATGTPVAVDVAAADVARDAVMTSGQYHGVYVNVTPGPFTISDTMAPDFLGTCPFTNDAGATTHYFGVAATGQGHTLDVGLSFYASVTWCTLDACDSRCTGNVITNQTFQTISGIVEPDSYTPPSTTTPVPYLKIMPTLDADLAM